MSRNGLETHLYGASQGSAVVTAAPPHRHMDLGIIVHTTNIGCMA